MSPTCLGLNFRLWLHAEYFEAPYILSGAQVLAILGKLSSKLLLARIWSVMARGGSEPVPLQAGRSNSSHSTCPPRNASLVVRSPIGMTKRTRSRNSKSPKRKGPLHSEFEARRIRFVRLAGSCPNLPDVPTHSTRDLPRDESSS